ncbi:MAG: HPr family phosphocarrier protein [Alphaproteobacteria bacterium]
MQSIHVEITNKSGLHTRPGKDFVQLAKTFESKIIVIKDDIEYNGKSLLKIMKAAICKGDKVEIKADGDDAETALKALQNYIETLDLEA